MKNVVFSKILKSRGTYKKERVDLSFWGKITLLITISRPTDVLARAEISFFFMAAQNSTCIHMCVAPIHSYADSHLGWVQLRVPVSDAAGHVVVQTSVVTQIHLGVNFVAQQLNHEGLVFNLLRNFQTDFQCLVEAFPIVTAERTDRTFQSQTLMPTSSIQ